MESRIEKDSFGPIDVPADKLWGAQTQRSLEHFHISTERMAPELVAALAQVKRAAAQVNRALGLLKDDAGRRDRARGRRSAGRQPSGRIPAGGVADRLRHPDQYEHERGAGQPRLRTAGRRARRRPPAASERPRQHGAVVERHLPHRDARGGGAGRRQRRAAGAGATARHAGTARRANSPTSSRSAAPTCRTPRR